MTSSRNRTDFLSPPESVMKRALHIQGFAVSCLFLIVAHAWPQESEDSKRALAIVKKVNGILEIDDKAPGRPVVSLNL